MKRILSLLIVMVLCFSVTANAKLPEALTEVYTNYTVTMETKLSGAEIKAVIDFFDELGLTEEIADYIDLEMLIESLLSEKEKMTVQADISKDFKKINLGITGEFELKAEFNKQLNVSANGKNGMWIKMDLSSSEPVFEIILITPFDNKYKVIDVFETLDEEQTKTLKETIAKVGNPEFIKMISDASVKMLEDHAEIKVSGNKCTIKISNDAFISMIEDMIVLMIDIVGEIAPEAIAEDPEVAKATVEIVKQAMPSLKGIKLLGENGITMEYTISSGKVTKGIEKFDMDFDVASLIEAVGEEWEFESRPVFSFDVVAEAKYSSYGKTKVNFPVLTEENSVNIYEKYAPKEYEEEEYVPVYPKSYFRIEVENVIKAEDKLYVPLRATLASAYAENINLAYENGVVTVTSPYFTDYDKMIFTVGSGEVKLGNETVNTDAVIIKDSTTYISEDAVLSILGAEITSARYDLLTNSYTVTFVCR